VANAYVARPHALRGEGLDRAHGAAVAVAAAAAFASGPT
jgi:hypothetical protein